MIPYLRSLVSLAFLLLLAACNTGTNQSKPSDPPASFSVTAGDGQVSISWDEQPGLQYYLFVAAANSISVADFTSGKSALPESRIIFPVTQYITATDGTRIKSPYIVPSLSNGTTYSFLINATKDGGPAGPASASIASTPRLAGAIWKAGTTIPGGKINGSGSYFDSTLGTIFLTAGDSGNIFKSLDLGQSWSANASNSTNNLNAIDYNNAAKLLIAVGDNGTLLSGVPSETGGATWSSINSGTTVRLNAVRNNASSQFVVVGDKGTILLSNDSGVTWTAQKSGVDKDLYALTYTGTGYMAVGAQGTILTSLDGATWTVRSSGTTLALYGIASASIGYVAVGEAGIILNSTDAQTWTTVTSNTKQTLYSVVGATQFVAVGASGTIVTSPEGTTWSVATSNTNVDLRNVAYLSGIYFTAGANGVNLTSR